MVKVAGHWEIGYMTPIQEQYYWSLVLREFGVTDWLMNPISGIHHFQKTKITLEEFESFEKALNTYSNLPRIFLEPRTKHQNPDTIWLHEFEHPEDCIYVFGSAHSNPTLTNKREQDIIVTIKTLDDSGSLWANQALAITLYDRMLKLWQ